MSDVIDRIDYGERGRVWIVQNPAALARAAAEFMISTVQESVDRDGYATVALSGGSTPKAMGHLLAEPGFRERIPWDRVHIFWGDERWVPRDSTSSNAGEAKRTFLDLVGLPEANVHPFETMDMTPEESAMRYESVIRSVLSGNPPAFDLILLGMGDDGHTASLFPGTEAVHETERLVLSHFVPNVDAVRLTMTPPLLNAGQHVAFLASGAAKAERLAEVLDGPIEIDRLPSQVVRPANGATWIVDRAAATSLAKRSR
jgi:6-phosphogluconolactonase